MYYVDGFAEVVVNGTIQRGEEVAIVLDPFFASSWKDSGGVWCAISSRLHTTEFEYYYHQCLCSNPSSTLN